MTNRLDTEVARIEVWFDRIGRTWEIIPVDKWGKQVEEARHGRDKHEALQIKRRLEEENGLIEYIVG